MTFWGRLTGRKAVPAETAPEPETAQPTSPAEVEVFELAQRTIRPGFLDLADVVERVQDHYEQRPDSPDSATVARLVGAAWQQRLLEQRSWPDQGDYGRVAAAFDELERAGFTARMDFTCCSNCGHTEIMDEQGPGEHSYVFFHQQDSERLADPDARLYLGYGYFHEHPDYDQSLRGAAGTDDPELQARVAAQKTRIETAVGAQIVQTLHRHGLDVQWDGDNTSRPAVVIREWRKPLIV